LLLCIIIKSRFSSSSTKDYIIDLNIKYDHTPGIVMTNDI